MTQEPALSLGWGRFCLKMAALFVWLLASPFLGAAAISSENTAGDRSLAMFLLFVPAVFLVGAQQLRIRRDEFDRELISRALMVGGQYVLVMAPVWMLTQAAFRAAGLIDESFSMERAAFHFLCEQAPLWAILGEGSAQLARRRLARPAA